MCVCICVRMWYRSHCSVLLSSPSLSSLSSQLAFSLPGQLHPALMRTVWLYVQVCVCVCTHACVSLLRPKRQASQRRGSECALSSRTMELWVKIAQALKERGWGIGGKEARGDGRRARAERKRARRIEVQPWFSDKRKVRLCETWR